ncbi:hypothetical protein [Salinispora oceanensis]|nr:hypothetical protein [Salinispora oceanensis]
MDLAECLDWVLELKHQPLPDLHATVAGATGPGCRVFSPTVDDHLGRRG